MTLQNMDAERAVLGCILLDDGLLQECRLVAKQFSQPIHRVIFQLMRELSEKGEPVDLPSLTARLHPRVLAQFGGIRYFTELAQSVPNVANFSHYEGLVRTAWKMAAGRSIAGELGQRLEQERKGEAIGEAITALSELEEADTPFSGSVREDLAEIYEELQQDTGDLQGVDTGFAKLNAMTGGLREGDFIVIGARPSVGKTAFALNLALQAAASNAAVGLFSLEMGRKPILKRCISYLAGISSQKLNHAKSRFTCEDWEKTSETMAKLHNLPFEVYDKAGITMQDIWTQTRRLKRQHPDQKILILVDYLQLIGGMAVTSEDRRQEISSISRRLKQMARDLKVCVAALSQLSRAVESRNNKRPMLSDLRETGQIEQDADVILLMYREDYYDREAKSGDEVEINVAKQRNGPVGTIKLRFVKECGQFL